MKKILLSIALVAAIVALIYKTINIDELLTTLQVFPKSFTFLVTLVIIAISLIKSLRMYMLLRMNSVKITFFQTVKAFMTSQAFTILPGGEVARAQLIRKECGAPLSEISPAVLLQAITELIGSALVVVVGCLFYPNFRLVGVISSALIGFGLFLIVHPRLLPALLKKVSNYKIVREHKETIMSFHEGILKSFFKDSAKSFRLRTGFIKNLALSLVSIFLGGVSLVLISRGFSVDLNVFQAMFIYSAGTVITGLSGFLPGGVGVTETGMSGLLIYMGIAKTIAVAIVLVYRAVSLILVVLFGLLLYGWYYRFSLKE